MMTTMLWTGRSKNSKTGDIPQGYVGATKAQANASCDGCPMRNNGCYYWQGTAVMGHSSMQKKYTTHPDQYSLSAALTKSIRSSRYVRGAVGGDPWVFTRETVEGWVDQIRNAGLRGLLLYTHFAKDKGKHLKGLAMASVHSLQEADDLIDDGWRTAMVTDQYRVPGSRKPNLKHLPEWNGQSLFVTPKGRKGIVCPAQYKQGVNCNTCGLCDAKHTGISRYAGDAGSLIVFLSH
tara:strand:- start:14845 stop:15549 length:705 start_codon:yes stop_codon:yes gene_type:complete